MSRKNKLQTRAMTTTSLPPTAPSDWRDELTCRSYAIAPGSYDAETRSIEAVIATESPTRVFDFRRNQVIEEVLLMSGCRLPDNGQVPLLDNHSRQTVSHVMGSCRDLRIDGDRLIGRNYFARRPAAQEAAEMARDGHLTDNSVGYRVLSAETIPAGKSRTINGRVFAASPRQPLRVVTEWEVLENSLCAIGADQYAKVRAAAARDDVNLNREYMTMEFKQWLSDRGFERDSLTDEQAASLRALYDSQQQQQIAEQAKRTAADEIKTREADILEQGRRAELERQKHIRRLAGEHIPDDVVQRAIDEGWSVDRAKDEFYERLRSGMHISTGSGPGIICRDGDDVSRRSLEAACMLRAGFDRAAEEAYDEQTLDVAERVRDLSMVDLCREALRLDHKSIPTNRNEMIRAAYSTASLPTILGNVANKSMLAGYNMLASTWERWCQIGSVQDFKEVTRARMTDIGDLEPVGNGGELVHGTAAEEAEKYAIATYGKIFAVTRKNIINDDLQVFTKTPRNLGIAASQHVQKLVYTHFLNPGNMGDGLALFHAKHGNLNASTPLTDENLSKALRIFRLQTNINGDPISVAPRYLLIPPSLDRIARRLLESDLLIGQGADAEPVPNKNIHRGVLDLIIEPRLENDNYTGHSDSTWYLIGDPAAIDTVEVAFLNGKRTPTVERFESSVNTLGVSYRVYIDVGAKAMDFRGLQKNTA